MSDLISVIVPVYNVENYLSNCIESLLNQTYRNIEIFLVDDGSTDRSGEICDAYFRKDPRIKVIHKKNGGQGSARNVALNRCAGKYICFVDSDDSVYPDYVEFLYEFLVKEDLDISVCNFEIYDEKRNLLRINRDGEGKVFFTGTEAIESMWYQELVNIGPWGKLYKKGLWKDVRFKECFSEDLATIHYVYINAKKVGYSFQPKLKYLVRSQSDIHSFNSRKTIMPQIAEDNLKFAKEYPELYKAALHKAVMVNFHVLLQMPSREYKNEKRAYKKFIIKHRKEVLRDKRCSKKTRAALFLSYFGFAFEKRILELAKRKMP